MAVNKSPKADLRSRYTIYVQIGLVVSLALFVTALSINLQSDTAFDVIEEEVEIIEVEEIEQTQQIERPPPPPQPPPPVEVPDDQIDEMIELDLDMDLDLDRAAAPPPPPPPPPAGEPEAAPEPEIFVVVEEMPEPIGGLEGIQNRVRYPEMARRAGIEGRVFVQFVVDEQGNPSEITVVRGIGGGADEAAMEAVRETQFRPGRQRGQAVRVRMSLPVQFRLR